MRRRQVAKTRSLLGSYPASSDKFLPTFLGNLPVPSSGFKNPKESILPKYLAQRTPAPPVVFFAHNSSGLRLSPLPPTFSF